MYAVILEYDYTGVSSRGQLLVGRHTTATGRQRTTRPINVAIHRDSTTTSHVTRSVHWRIVEIVMSLPPAGEGCVLAILTYTP